MRTLLASIFLLIPAASIANGEVTVKDYRAALASPDADVVNVMKIYVRGMGDGVAWANVALANNKVYCPPPNLSLGAEMFIDIIDRELKTMVPKDADALLIGAALVRGLQHTYPCKGQ